MVEIRVWIGIKGKIMVRVGGRVRFLVTGPSASF